MSRLFEKLATGGVTLRNRVVVSPMCMYSAKDGVPEEWHHVHLGSRAVGGAGAVIAEATAVVPEGRISPADTGIWNDRQADAWARTAAFIRGSGAAPGIQLAHAGRKASTAVPWLGGGPLAAGAAGGWAVVGPSAVAFAEGYPTPRALTVGEIDGLVESFAKAATRAARAGFEIIELHAAHGYLLHQFLSPLSNRREDDYGGSEENRTRLLVRVSEAVRSAVPAGATVWARISATDWAEGGWDLEQSVRLARRLAGAGVDLVDCSSGGLVAGVKIPVGPGYQVGFADTIRREAKIATGAVGMITEPRQAEEIVASGKADVVLLARALLRDPYWPLHAAKELGVEGDWPAQYLRGR